MTSKVKEFFDKVQKYFDKDERNKAKLEQDVKLHTLTYDKDMDRYRLDTTTKIKLKDIPMEAVHVSGKKKEHLVEKINLDYDIDPRQCTAVDLTAWMDNNDIEEAIAYSYKKDINIDMKKVLIIGGCIIAGLIIFMMVR